MNNNMDGNMYNNIGGQLKNWAKCIFVILAIGSFIGACICWGHTESVYQGKYSYPQYKDVHTMVGQGFGVLIGGVLAAWFCSTVIYAFGELVENSTDQY